MIESLPNEVCFKSGKHAGQLKVAPAILKLCYLGGPKTMKEIRANTQSLGYTGQQIDTLKFLRQNGYLVSNGRRPMELAITRSGYDYLVAKNVVRP